MSIILEALDKISKETKKKKISLPEKRADSSLLISTISPRRKKNIYLPLALAILGITAIPLLFLTITKNKDKQIPIPETHQEIYPVIPQSEEKKVPALPQLKVSGIIWNDQGPTALVNNKLVAPGDEINGAKIIAIEQTSVKFHYQDSEFQIPLED